MRQQLQQYVALLFAGVQGCEEIQQEILQNTLDRYDDLIAQGQPAAAAYRLAISSIGDINEILNNAPAARSANIQNTTAKNMVRQHMARGRKPAKWIPIAIVVIVCLCLIAGIAEILDELPRRNRFNRYDNVDLTIETVVIEETSRTVTLGKAATVYTAPSEDAGIGGQLEAGTEITIQRQENVGNKLWAYISDPIQGWMVLENHETETDRSNAPESPESYAVFFSEAVNVYSSPSADGSIQGELEAGTVIGITRQELINGKEWVYTVSPIQGWILTEGLTVADGTPTEPADPATATAPADLTPVTEPIAPVENTVPASADLYGSSLEAKDISSISIDWLSGNVSILTGEDDRIYIEEPEGDQQLVWNVKNGKLSIDFCEKSLMKGFRLGGAKAKDLTVTIPKNWVGRELEIDAASSDLVLQNVTVQQVEIDAASGRTEFIDCDLSSLDIETASGDIYFVGYLDVLECDAASANFVGTLKNSPRSIEMESVSGSLDLTIPADTGFTVRMEGIKTIFSAQDFQLKKQNNAYIHGDGACRIEMESVSGGVQLQKAK